MHQSLIHHRWKSIALALLLAATSSSSYADTPSGKSPYSGDPFLSMDSWQEPMNVTPSSVRQARADDVNAIPPVPSAESMPGVHIVPALPDDQLSPNGGCNSNGDIDLYPGGSASDWSWGCGGSPYRNGPGFCDNWKVGCRWETQVEGMLMFREKTDLNALRDIAAFNSVGAALPAPDVFENFDHAIGGRVSFTGYMPRWANYNLQAVYEGTEPWNASIVFPKISPEPDPNLADAVVPPADSFEQHTLFYRTSLHSGELNFVRLCNPVWRPYMGVRFLRIADEINDTINQEAPFPLPATPAATADEVDRINILDLENNLIGLQVGVRRDIWRLGKWCSVEGFANAGVYHNKIKRTNLMEVDTLHFVGGTNASPNSGRTDSNSVQNIDISDLTEISYVAEASVTAVCRLNRCCALRAGYQFMWVDNIRLADDEYLNTGVTNDLIFQGWHAGVEYRR